MKNVAESLKKITTSDIFARILDPKDDVEDIIALLKEHWRYDLYSRRPGPALLEDGVLKPTDLDLACFLAALVDRKAVIDIPKYVSRRAQTIREGEHVVSKDHRHGHVLGLTSNKDVFSFSIRINDVNVISSDGEGNDTVGAPRNFMLVDLEGNWYEGWQKIVFMPSRKENDFLNDKRLWTGNEVVFKNFVHPNRWVSFYGQWYILTKLLVERLRNEAKFRSAEARAMEAVGIHPPVGTEKEWPETTQGESVPIIVNAFEAEVDAEIPETFPAMPETQDGLVAAKKRASKLRYEDVPLLNFACRATEMAFEKMGNGFHLSNKGAALNEPFPSWITGAGWDHNYKIKRTVWNRLVLHQRLPFTKSLALRYRIYKKTERVSPRSV